MTVVVAHQVELKQGQNLMDLMLRPLRSLSFVIDGRQTFDDWSLYHVQFFSGEYIAIVRTERHWDEDGNRFGLGIHDYVLIRSRESTLGYYVAQTVITLGPEVEDMTIRVFVGLFTPHFGIPYPN